MALGKEFAVLFRRDLTKLAHEVSAFPDEDSLWKTIPGITNPAGNLVLHLEGNLREYIARILVGLEYQRSRTDEFGKKHVPQAELSSRVKALCDLIPVLLEEIPDARWSEEYPQVVLGQPMSNHQFVVHLQGHFNYHLGQIDYLRRVLTGGSALEPIGL